MTDLLERLAGSIEIDTEGCWIWQRALSDGYGSISVGGQSRGVHRVAYELLVEPVDPSLEVDHLCRVRACCNPDHLEPVTTAENQKRGLKGMKTHCKNNHTLTYLPGEKQRRCLTCKNDRERARYARERAVRAGEPS